MALALARVLHSMWASAPRVLLPGNESDPHMILPTSRVLEPSHAHRAATKLCLAVVAAVATIPTWPRSAAADTVVGVDLNFNDAITEDNDDDAETGAGVDVFFGPRLDLTLLTLTTELSGGFHDLGGDADPTVYRLLAGGRLGLGAIIRPSVFAHLGVGHVRFDNLLGGRDGRTHLAGDVGAALDFTLLPLINLGIQGSYNAVAGNDDEQAIEWLQAGVHVTFVLDDA